METQKYFDLLNKQTNIVYIAAEKARKKGYDPIDKVEIPLVKNLAERVEGLISSVAPQIIGKGIPSRIKVLEEKYGSMDWRVALTISLEVAQEKFCKFKDKREAIEVGIRVGFAYITIGTVASPLEGFTELKIRKTRDGKDYFALMYSGPVRSAGGTGASVSVLIADYLRKKLGFAEFDPDEKEVKRFVTEAYDYHERITNLQYLPSIQEIEFIASHLPVQIDGEPSEKIEVSNYKDLKRVETNMIRNGVCLVLCEGLAQKAPKVLKQIHLWGKDFELEHWLFLDEFVKLQKRTKAKTETTKKLNPDFTFIADLVAGRPVITYPLRKGGLRLRYGRARTSGYSASAINPLTMKVLDDFIAIGTQLKVERPGKATVVSSCDLIEGPIVKFKDGSVEKIEKESQLKDKEVKKILFLGDILLSYGDFFNRNHLLVPAGYCEEWWSKEFEKSIVDNFGTLDAGRLALFAEIPIEEIENLLKDQFAKPSAKTAVKLSQKLNIPLHPYYTFYWAGTSLENLKAIILWMNHMKLEKDEQGTVIKIILPYNQEGKEAFEDIGLPHTFVNNEFVVVEKEYALPLIVSIGINTKTPEEILSIIEQNKEKDVQSLLDLISEIKLRDKCGVFIGARMGRPEKAKIRQLTGSPQVLFPVGDEGGRLRSFQSAMKEGKIKGEFPVYFCSKCKKETIFPICEMCETKTQKKYICEKCGLIDDTSCLHGPAKQYKTMEIDINHYINTFLEKLELKSIPDLIKGVRGTSNESHTPEHLFKGILRAKHDVYVNKDGTIRYDMTQMPLTHFKPAEVRTSIEKLKELGYTHDVYGKELIEENQILELLPQDIVLPACEESPDLGADKVLLNIGNFVDELLSRFYKEETFYNFKKTDDIIGHLALVLAPHTSAGIVTRIIGFSKTQGFLAHPLLHAATRRDCDGDEASVSLLADALINFSKEYLPSHRGSRQDAPLVLTSNINASEVDDMVFDLDIDSSYPLEFYLATLEFKDPREVKIQQIKGVLNTGKEYQGLKFTHDTTNFNKGVRCSAYKTIPSMEDKLKGQMILAEKIRAVDLPDVARLVIEKHFIKDIKGNLRKFSMQQFRCVKCNEKYRRPPLIGKCTRCGGRIIFTISKGFVTKYLEPSLSLARKYDIPAYLKHSMILLERRVEDVFGKDKEEQAGLGRWFG